MYKIDLNIKSIITDIEINYNLYLLLLINMNREEKVAEGIYITKFNNTTGVPEKKNYIYKTTSELIAIIEAEFDESGELIKSLYKSNEEMLEYDPNDYDLIQGREDNLVLINNKLKRMIQLQNEMKNICSNHPMIKIDVINLFDQNMLKEEKENIVYELEL